MSKKKIKWVSVHDKLPERYAQVLTLLFRSEGYDLATNSIQGMHIQEADGNLLTVYQWEKENLRVEYWLSGLPELPIDPPQSKENERRIR